MCRLLLAVLAGERSRTCARRASAWRGLRVEASRRGRLLANEGGVVTSPKGRDKQQRPSSTFALVVTGARRAGVEIALIHGPRTMRLTAALLALACLTACSGVQTVTEPPLARDDEWRQAELDAQAIMQGMAQARQRAEQLAHTER
jgi:hypothetical protein